MEEGIFPGYKSILEPKELEEERRLCYVGVTRAKNNLFLTCAKKRTIFGSTNYNPISRFVNEVPVENLDGLEQIDKNTNEEDTSSTWRYGNTKLTSKLNEQGTNKMVDTGYKFRTAESFLNNLSSKPKQDIDLSKYKSGVRVYHKKFGEGTINYVEQEEEDLKVDISFDKVGHKRLMARFAGLEIIN